MYYRRVWHMSNSIITIKDGHMYVEISEHGDVAVGLGNAEGQITAVKGDPVKGPWVIEKGHAKFIDRATWYSGSPLCVWHGDREY